MMIKNLTTNMKSYNQKHERCCEYIEALEEERRKINVFQRELPLCLELVSQAIEAYKKEISLVTTREKHVYGQSEECSEETTGECGTILDLFIPITKHSSTSTQDHDDDDDDDDESHETCIEFNDNNMKSEWLKSVQLWNQPEAVLSNKSERSQQETAETIVDVIKGNDVVAASHQPPCGDVKSTADLITVDAEKHGRGGRGKRKQRRCWSQDLHRRFLNALKQLGGPHVATPKEIRKFMKVDGLTNDEVKSHLQKYRLHTRRPNQTIHNNRNSQTQHLVVVGGMWVPQANHAATANAVVSGETTNGIYGPMVSPRPIEWPSHTDYGHRRMISEDRSRCYYKGTNRCSSPALSSSTYTKINKDAKIL